MKNNTNNNIAQPNEAMINDLIKRSKEQFLQKNYSESLNLANQVIKTEGGHIQALLIAAKNLERLQHYQVAVDIYNRILASDKENVGALNGLSEVYFFTNNHADSERVLTVLLNIDPNNFEALFGLGILNKLKRDYETALMFLSKANDIRPNVLEVVTELCSVVYLTDSIDEAKKHYLKLYEFTKKPGYLVTAKTLVPFFFESNEAIDSWRKEYKNSLIDLANQSITIANPLEEIKQSYHQTLYQNRKNKELSMLYAGFLRKASPMLNYTAPYIKDYKYNKNEKIKLGFIFRYNDKHAVADAFFDFLDRLSDNDKFDTHIFTTSQVPVAGDIWEKYSKKQRAIQLPFDIKASQDLISEYKLDIVIHPELGINTLSYFLSFARLAPVQSSFTGIPITSGVDTVDYYISERSIETDDVQDNFSEKVILMENKAYFPVLKEPSKNMKTREQLGLPLDKKIYTAPLKLQKFHPDFDRVIGRLLEKDKNGIFLIFEDKKSLTERIRSRLETNLDKEIFSRIKFVPMAIKDDFPNYLNAVDCVLDSYYYGCGTTGYITFNYGIPVVTMKKGFLVGGRLAASFYERANITGLTAESEDDFINICFNLANDKAKYESLKQSILQKKYLLSENERSFDEILEIFGSIVKN